MSYPTENKIEETLVDMALDFGAAIARDKISVPDSRELVGFINDRAHDFERVHGGVDWNVTGDYIDKIEAWTKECIEEWNETATYKVR